MHSVTESLQQQMVNKLNCHISICGTKMKHKILFHSIKSILSINTVIMQAHFNLLVQSIAIISYSMTPSSTLCLKKSDPCACQRHFDNFI